MFTPALVGSNPAKAMTLVPSISYMTTDGSNYVPRSDDLLVGRSTRFQDDIRWEVYRQMYFVSRASKAEADEVYGDDAGQCSDM